EDCGGTRGAPLDEVGDACREHARLAAATAREGERALPRQRHRPQLLGGEGREDFLHEEKNRATKLVRATVFSSNKKRAPFLAPCCPPLLTCLAGQGRGTLSRHAASGEVPLSACRAPPTACARRSHCAGSSSARAPRPRPRERRR